MITIIDYGVGNIRAFANIYKQLNIPIKFARKADDLEGTSKLILPGVGAFDYAMERLENSGMRDQLDKLVLVNEIPVLGICVGMQMLANGSDEGRKSGLGWIDAFVKKFEEKQIQYATRLPHMGWNNIQLIRQNKLLADLPDEAKFYFLHSYYFECFQQDYVVATTQYGIDFSCAVNKNNIYGVQFHPEKSHQNGIQLLLNFANL
jgi:imidazole glycerol-phosphate synthase subunit HisH